MRNLLLSIFYFFVDDDIVPGDVATEEWMWLSLLPLSSLIALMAVFI
ncbi:hypothetical protein JFL43_10865 [Viridibacillus sp. YIM B01967]|uniref:Uncharacterized protein n=1 Tax=Viridibacillus soli TaxID=2798301 RepID=A0ABS1H7F6_9BACL|nr:hypothetical protein [Viridibacillus soli]MBK3495341.1 hypothetical protein [Viridibacillus soli]